MPPIPKNPHFSRVQEAREVIKSKAAKWADLYDKTIEAALKRGEVEVAGKLIQWALEHMPNEDGVGAVDAGVDRPRATDPNSGPVIKIGLALGGLGTSQPALPPAPTVEVIEIQPEKVEKEPNEIKVVS